MSGKDQEDINTELEREACESDTEGISSSGKDDEVENGKKVIGTVRYEEDENEEETETVALFVSARKKEQAEKIESVAINEQAIRKDLSTNKSNPPKKSGPPPVFIVALISGGIFILIAFFLISAFVKDVNNDPTYSEENVSESIEGDDQSDENVDAVVREALVLDAQYYHDFSGMTINYPSEWTISEDENHFILLVNTGSEIEFFGAPVNQLLFYNDGKATEQEMAVSLMQLDVDDINADVGTVLNYTDSINIGDKTAYVTADFVVTDASGLTLKYHLEKMILNGYFVSAKLITQDAYYEESSAVFLEISSHLVLPNN